MPRDQIQKGDSMTEERIRGFSFQKDLTVQIADASQTWLKCQFCGVVDEQLIVAPCQHTFCQNCVRDYNDVLQCPVHRTCYSPSQLTTNASIKASLRQLAVFCLHKERGCLRTVKLQDLEKHLSTCGFVQLNCPCECGEKICRRELAHHLIHLCDNRLVSCQYCEDEISYKYEEEHLIDCPKKPVTCQYCSRQFINDQVLNHSQQCPMKPMPCHLARTIGCNFQGTSQELEKHRKDMEGHLSLAIQKISEFEDTKKDVTSIEDEIGNIKKQSQDTRNNVTELVKELKSTRSQIKKTDDDVSSLVREVRSAKAEIQETKEEISSLVADLRSTRNEIQGLSEIRKSVLHFEKQSSSSHQEGQKEMKKMKDDMVQMLSDITSLKETVQRNSSPNEEPKPSNSYKRGAYRIASPPTKL